MDTDLREAREAQEQDAMRMSVCPTLRLVIS
jgi:hypothetical protein